MIELIDAASNATREGTSSPAALTNASTTSSPAAASPDFSVSIGSPATLGIPESGFPSSLRSRKKGITRYSELWDSTEDRRHLGAGEIESLEEEEAQESVEDRAKWVQRWLQPIEVWAERFKGIVAIESSTSSSRSSEESVLYNCNGRRVQRGARTSAK